jgi:hypothetical protein
MTKCVRVENADTSNHPIVVQVVDTNHDGSTTVVQEHFLNDPTAMTPPNLCIWKGRFLVVKEYEPVETPES